MEPGPDTSLHALEGKPTPGPPRGDAAEHATAHEDHRRGGRRLLCARCRFAITTERDRVDISDRHEHIFTNPAGFAYRIGCFTAAPGCEGVGRIERYWSWFPGYSWQIAVCRACSSHLGWAFRAADKRFYGLILDRLTAESPDDD